MALTAEQVTRLAEIDEIIASGISGATSSNGRSISYNLAALRRERDELRQLATFSHIGSRFRRVLLTDG